MLSIKTIKELLAQHNLKPLKKLGQNFLITSSVVDKIIESGGLTPNDVVLEVGPGLGGVTIEIAKKVKQVIAIEKDRGLSNVLRELLKQRGINNVEVINKDVLNFQFSISNFQTKTKKYKLISNLPYNIATAVIMQFLETENPPEVMIVMLQKEVGQRICSNPPNMSKLAVFSQFYSTVKIIKYISKGNFYPQPKVDSVILKITPKKTSGNKWARSCPFVAMFSKIVKAGFANPRKQLLNNLSKGLDIKKEQTEQWLKENKIAPTQRAETLTIENWVNITNTYPHKP